MLNFVWPLFIVVSIVFAIATGKANVLNDALFDSAKDTVSLCISLLGTICLWNRVYADYSKYMYNECSEKND